VSNVSQCPKFPFEPVEGRRVEMEQGLDGDVPTALAIQPSYTMPIPPWPSTRTTLYRAVPRQAAVDIVVAGCAPEDVKGGAET
jgi:hypothetical protein